MKIILRLATALMVVFGLAGAASAQDQGGPFLPHSGLKITTAFASSFGPDAESTFLFQNVSPAGSEIHYTSSRGVVANRLARAEDVENSSMVILGFADGMPNVIPGTTTLGVSRGTLRALRQTGRADLSLIYDTTLTPLPGTLTVTGRDVMMGILVENQPLQVKAMQVEGTFGSGSRTATGRFLIHDSTVNPVTIDYSVQFSWEKSPRTERVVQVTAGASEQAAMQQALATFKAYDTYGIHFAFDSAKIQAQSAQVLADIGTTLKNNPGWTLLVVGHTDSIGDAAYNQKLSRERADSVKNWLVTKEGIDAARLTTDGKGETEPKATNDTLEGRKQNRRVELKRTDN